MTRGMLSLHGRCGLKKELTEGYEQVSCNNAEPYKYTRKTSVRVGENELCEENGREGAQLIRWGSVCVCGGVYMYIAHLIKQIYINENPIATPTPLQRKKAH